MSTRTRGFRILSAASLALLCGLPAQAQNYPTRPVTFITPAAAGNSPDVATRIVADRLTQIWKQQIVVLNRPGAGGLIAAQAAAGVEKDGYTLYMTQASTYTVLPIDQEGKMPVNLQTAFVPIGMVGEQPIAVAVNKDVPVSNVAELVTLANKTSGGMLFGATNRGGQAHLTGELFRDRSKANISFVHAAAGTVTMNDVIAGRIPIMFEGLAGLAPGLQGGGMKALGVASQKRLPNLPDLPAINETIPRCRIQRLDRADGTSRHARAHHPENQCRPPQGGCHAGCHRALPDARHLHARSDAGADQRLHAQRRAPVVADRAAGQPAAGRPGPLIGARRR